MSLSAHPPLFPLIFKFIRLDAFDTWFIRNRLVWMALLCPRNCPSDRLPILPESGGGRSARRAAWLVTMAWTLVLVGRTVGLRYVSLVGMDGIVPAVGITSNSYFYWFTTIFVASSIRLP